MTVVPDYQSPQPQEPRRRRRWGCLVMLALPVVVLAGWQGIQIAQMYARGACTVEGILVDEFGSPIGDAEIEIKYWHTREVFLPYMGTIDCSGTRTVRADSQGRFSFRFHEKLLTIKKIQRQGYRWVKAENGPYSRDSFHWGYNDVKRSPAVYKTTLLVVKEDSPVRPEDYWNPPTMAPAVAPTPPAQGLPAPTSAPGNAP